MTPSQCSLRLNSPHFWKYHLFAAYWLWKTWCWKVNNECCLISHVTLTFHPSIIPSQWCWDHYCCFWPKSYTIGQVCSSLQHHKNTPPSHLQFIWSCQLAWFSWHFYPMQPETRFSEWLLHFWKSLHMVINPTRNHFILTNYLQWC